MAAAFGLPAARRHVECARRHRHEAVLPTPAGVSLPHRQVAEECGLKRLWTKCIREICVTMSRGKKGVGPRTVRVPAGAVVRLGQLAAVRGRAGCPCSWCRWQGCGGWTGPCEWAYKVARRPTLPLPGRGRVNQQLLSTVLPQPNAHVPRPAVWENPASAQCHTCRAPLPPQVSSQDLQGALAGVPTPSDNMYTAVHDVALLKVGGVRGANKSWVATNLRCSGGRGGRAAGIRLACGGDASSAHGMLRQCALSHVRWPCALFKTV